MSEDNTMKLSNIGQNLKWFRKMRSMTQKEVAEAAHISLSFYKSMESTNDAAPSLETLMSICMALNIPLDVVVKDCGERLFSDYANSVLVMEIQKFNIQENEAISKLIMTLYETINSQTEKDEKKSLK